MLLSSLRLTGALVALALLVASCDGTGGGTEASPRGETSPRSMASNNADGPIITAASSPINVGACTLPRPVTPADRPLKVEPKAECDEAGTAYTPDGIPFGVYINRDQRYSALTGRVSDFLSLEPIQGAIVTLTLKTLKIPLVARTDDLGQFAFLNLPVGDAGCSLGAIEVQASGYGLFRLTHQAFEGAQSYGQNVPIERRVITESAGERCHS